MKFSKSTFLFGILLVLTTMSLYAKSSSDIHQNMGQAYLSHWFSYDSLEPTNFVLRSLDADQWGERAEFTFSSDDGQIVNGLIAFPEKRNTSAKLAFALHPMGSNQQFWWREKTPFSTQKMTNHLRQQGYTVISLDARRHGKRGSENFGPRELLKRAHSPEPRLYIDTIIGSVRDYRIALNWAKKEFSADQVLVMGYSMGAQMSLLLASLEPSVNTVLAMVPPYVGSPTSPVAPRVHVNKITTAKVLWLAGTNDPYSDKDQTQETFDRITSTDKTLTWFDAGHRLPPEFVDTALSFFNTTLQEGE